MKPEEAEDLSFSTSEARESFKTAVGQASQAPTQDNELAQSVVEDSVPAPVTSNGDVGTIEEQTVSAQLAPVENRSGGDSLSENGEIGAVDSNTGVTHRVKLGGSVSSLDEVGRGGDGIASDGNAVGDFLFRNT